MQISVIGVDHSIVVAWFKSVSTSFIGNNVSNELYVLLYFPYMNGNERPLKKFRIGNVCPKELM